MQIDLPSIKDQQKIVFKKSTDEAILQLKANLKAPVLDSQGEIDEGEYGREHLLLEACGWLPPHPDVVSAYFRHFQYHFEEYKTDKKLALFLGLSSDRRVRAFKDGSKTVPYGAWRKFLVVTGRAPQEVLPVLGFLG